MQAVYRLARRAAPSGLPIVVSGETGTGKELVARAIHALSGRARAPFVDLNCAALPKGLVESELFGWERGAFTGAHRRVEGLLAAAHGGTLFLDEACSLSVPTQAKLLRAIEQLRFRRLGGRREVRSDFRLVLAVSQPLADLRRTGVWRDDFAFRVAAVTLHLPPLRSRGRDIRVLAEHLLGAAGARCGRRLRWHADALTFLERYDWPGNVRELVSLVERLAVLTTNDLLGVEDLIEQGLVVSGTHTGAEDLAAAVGAAGGNLSRAARALGVPRSTLRSRITKAERERPRIT